ncbi:carboxynorspermidine decarboxylase [uncultured Ruminococcus sp.]|uniref:carboxynorspermidine decarboxylase n=1 Tax=uncultured Ruminococcus sp. TaxID=165186 RepID=UPI002674B44F|nr:carboxynorspermidine decarboxylase [uncultured Ruminococcus sp.]
MDFESLFDIPIDDLHTPCYLTDARLLQKNTALLKQIQQRTGCKILLAQKAFSMFSAYPLIRDDLAGTTASGLFEAKLGREHFEKEVHVFSPAYTQEDFTQLLELCDHIVFNSFGQWKKYRQQVQDATRNISCGIRINPGYAEVETDLYNPCISGSRMGVPLEQMEEDGFDGLDGIHFHTMCEQNSDVLERTLDHMLPQFDKWLKRCKWVNFGGGHHITRPDYDVERLVRCIERVRDTYGVQVYLEPGEAVALNAGYLVATVLDVVHNGMDIAILDASAACHMPDVLEMPYRPHILYSGTAGEKAYTYRLAGNTCLAGDVIGDYSFDHQLQAGEKLVFCDMAIYSMVKNNTFNGVPLPDIALYQDGKIQLVKRFGYIDFEGRLS